jgi:3-phosphoshikimate 1-carboxyvinyltransferase
MGACIASNSGTPPLDIVGGPLQAIVYEMPVASAQVKSAVILAAVYADGTTEVIEKVHTRDHTERMLRALGVPIRRQGDAITVKGGIAPRPFDLRLPGDPSSAAFFLAAGALTGGTIEVQNLLVNETRLGFVRTLAAMGAQVETCGETESLGEPIGSVRVRGAVRNAVTVEAAEVPSLIDELPLVALLATQTRGTTTVSGAAELRVKETDRIETVVDGLRRLGADIEPLPDGFRVSGPTDLRGADVQSSGDHRVAMMLAVAGLIASGTTVVHGVEAADISFPGFASRLAQMGGAIETV